MIICTGCGKNNNDDVRFCEKCGKKLQSSRQLAPSTESSSKPLTRFAHEGMPHDRWVSFRRLIEAWVYLAVLIGVAAGCVIYKTLWPMYPSVILLGLLLYFRRI